MPKKKKSIKIQYFDLHPYPVTLGVVVGETIHEAFAKVRKETRGVFCAEEPRGVAACHSGVNPKGEFFIFLTFSKDIHKHPGTVAHECIHVMSAVYEEMGVKYDTFNDESTAYFFGQLVETVHTCLKNAR